MQIPPSSVLPNAHHQSSLIDGDARQKKTLSAKQLPPPVISPKPNQTQAVGNVPKEAGGQKVNATSTLTYQKSASSAQAVEPYDDVIDVFPVRDKPQARSATDTYLDVEKNNRQLARPSIDIRI